MTTTSELRQALTAEIGTRVKPAAWTILADAGHVARAIEALDLGAIDRDIVIRDLAADYEDIVEPDVAEDVPGDRRADVLAAILAREAAELPAVKDFRRRLPRGRLLEPSQVADWIERTSRRDGPRTRLVTVPDHDRNGTHVWEEWPVMRYRRGDGAVYPVYVNIGGKLGRLREIARLLGSRYSWSQPDAVAFVLAGEVPSLTMARVSARAHLRHAPLGTITLTINARMSPREVGHLYAAARRALLGHGRDRELKEQWRADLALFIAETNAPGVTWRAAMDIWNERNPGHAFTDWRHFQRACTRNYERITGRSLEWLGGRRAGREDD